jgi:hypothetical protein
MYKQSEIDKIITTVYEDGIDACLSAIVNGDTANYNSAIFELHLRFNTTWDARYSSSIKFPAMRYNIAKKLTNHIKSNYNINVEISRIRRDSTKTPDTSSASVQITIHVNKSDLDTLRKNIVVSNTTTKKINLPNKLDEFIPELEKYITEKTTEYSSIGVDIVKATRVLNALKGID